MGEVLFLCHRIPYPPNKGDKIRAYHWLRALAERHTVHLGTFVDDADDWAWRETLDGWCDRQCYRPLDSRRARLRSVSGLWRGQALSFGYYRDRVLARWVDTLMAERPIDAVLVFSSTMAPYVDAYPHTRRVMDFVDVDSDKWAQYAASIRGPMRWVYAREARTLLAGERQLAAQFDASVFVSDAEAEFFRRAAPESAARVHAIGNGVDSAYFDPALDHADPYRGGGKQTIVFTGAMDYGANIDAAVWFVEQVLPLVRRTTPEVAVAIVGTRPSRRVQSLAQEPGVTVTGTVADVRPYLAHAAVAIAPMRIARGIQNKVLEALSMGRPVVMTEQAAAGLETADTEFAAITSEPSAFARAVLAFMSTGKNNERADAARRFTMGHYGWPAQFERLLALVDSRGPRRSQRVSA